MKIKEETRYFLGIVPPAPIAGQVEQFKTFVAAEYKSKAALRSPPHITLHMPFNWEKRKADLLISTLGEFCSRQQPFMLHLDGFGSFSPRVIFVCVTPTNTLSNLETTLIRTCREKLNLNNALYKTFPFHPHLTIAFRDLKKDQFEIAWSHFRQQSYEASFEVAGISLFRHDDNRWIIERTFSFAHSA